MPGCDDCPTARTRAGPGWVAPEREVPLSGIINVDKPAGMTSHDVVVAVRRMAGQRKVGHAGTLDPLATGVLLICLGAATRVTEYLMAGRKRYRATMLLGVTTDTYDADGAVVSRGERPDLTLDQIAAALEAFRGPIQQVPPMYSAVKLNGQALYRRARRGETVERAARRVEIDDLVLLDWTPPTLVVEVACSPGTYVRSLAHDLGQSLGCGAHLTALVRLSSGRFTLEESVSLGCLEEAFQHGQPDQYLLPMDEALLDWPALILGPEDARRIAQGLPADGEPPAEGEGSQSLCRAYDLDGTFLGVLAYHSPTGRWQPKKVFAVQSGQTAE